VGLNLELGKNRPKLIVSGCSKCLFCQITTDFAYCKLSKRDTEIRDTLPEWCILRSKILKCNISERNNL